MKKVYDATKEFKPFPIDTSIPIRSRHPRSRIYATAAKRLGITRREFIKRMNFHKEQNNKGK